MQTPMAMRSLFAQMVAAVQRVATAAQQIAASVQIGAVALQTIASELAKQDTIGEEVQLELEVKGENSMTAKAKATGTNLIIDTANARLYAVGLDSLGAAGAQLAPGASVAGASSDLTVASLVPDSPPLPDPSGNPSVYSAAIVATTPPVTGKPTTLSVVVTNADTTTQPPATAVVQFTPGTETSLELEEL
jgi:hypothetical protein